MIVVSDTSVLCYLAILDLADILKRRFKRVSIPREVVTEATFPRAPAPLQALLRSLPDWLIVESAPPLDLPALDRLDQGEAAAIRLAIHQGADFVLTLPAREARSARRVVRGRRRRERLAEVAKGP